MALEYRLTVATELPAEVIARRAFPDVAERPTTTGRPGLLGGDLYDRYGYTVSVLADDQAYIEAADSDDAMWTWEPPSSVDVTFTLDKDDPDRGLRHLLPVVTRVLGSGDEDSALIFNGDYLLLNRIGGVLTKHRRAQWWDAKPWMDQLMP
jgi:hypothetical protein